jgi:hypothetical protein
VLGNPAGLAGFEQGVTHGALLSVRWRAAGGREAGIVVPRARLGNLQRGAGDLNLRA